MKALFSLILGLLSGIMICLEAAIFFDLESGTSFFITFFVGWIASSVLIDRGARTVSKVLSRGFLIGAAEWLMMIPIGMIIAGNAASEVGADTDAEKAVAMIGGGLMAFLTGGVAVAMALVCLLCFAVTNFLGREMKPEVVENTKKCHYCAELIKVDARKCRFCGADLESLEIS